LKIKHVLLIVLLVLLLDQGLKIYIKLNFALGDEVNVFGSWFRLHFIENSGMAFGMNLGDRWGKLALSLFRLAAVVWGLFFIKNKLVGKGYPNGLLVCAALILAGALGNLIDSILYGKIFTISSYHSTQVSQLVPWGEGYGDVFYGKVVDMLYFPLFVFQWPDWLPIVGGNTFEFFRPVFNIADASIFIGVLSILLLQRRFLKNEEEREELVPETSETTTVQESTDEPLV
jgi:signal peptidase II